MQYQPPIFIAPPPSLRPWKRLEDDEIIALLWEMM
jgi:hypothetical protein